MLYNVGMTKRFAIFTLIFITLVLLIGWKLAGKANNVASEQPILTELKVCSSVDTGAPCEENVDTFDPDIGDLYATVYAVNIEASTLLVKWVYIMEGTESVIAESEQEIFADDFIQLWLEKSLSRGWLEGNYRVEVELIDQSGSLVQEEFRIQAPL